MRHAWAAKWFVVAILFVVALGVAIFILTPDHVSNSSKPTVPAKSNLVTKQPASTPAPTPAPQPSVVQPTDGFLARVTKKPFGIYLTPQNSPVQPERFTGYHTGTDAEYGDIAADVPVNSIADGTVTLAQWVSGYGGVEVIRTDLPIGQKLVLYGHLRPSSLLAVGTQVTKGQQIAVLGTAYSNETDGERRHLHLAVLVGGLDLRGYVQSKSELSGWVDPVTLFK
jgi:murein DD-endopeptidase MepM/ murein hydrolase activator NlpD